MTRDEQVQYLRIALAIQHIGANDETVDRLIETYELLLRKQGAFTVDDATNIQIAMDRKYAEKKVIYQPQTA